MTVCPSCGKELPGAFPFCPFCGVSLTVAVPDPVHEERKVVTVLFADLVGFTKRAETMDPEDVRALLSPYYERLRVELERFGGTVEKFIGDAVMALFGAPVAHEDDPERAVRAALAIGRYAGEEGIELRIGITTGEALVRLSAKPELGETVATGDVVNTAARLQAELRTLRLDRDFQSSDSLEVDPDLRIILDDLGEHVVAVRAAEHDAGTSVDVNGPGRPGCTAAATGPDRGCHLDGEHLL